MGRKWNSWDFYYLTLWAYQASIVNRVEIGITLIPNMDVIRLQTFQNKKYGRLVIDDIYIYICKRQFYQRGYIGS